jgi:hypothetical protein
MNVYVQLLEPVGNDSAGSKLLVSYAESSELAMQGKATVLGFADEIADPRITPQEPTTPVFVKHMMQALQPLSLPQGDFAPGDVFAVDSDETANALLADGRAVMAGFAPAPAVKDDKGPKTRTVKTDKNASVAQIK